MISAFGIEHGEISKGLPSAMRNTSENFGDRLPKSVGLRIMAHNSGKDAAKMKATKRPFWNQNDGSYPISQGKKYRARGKRMTEYEARKQ